MLTFEDIKKKWFESKAGVLSEHDLRCLAERRDGETEHRYYECPCGGEDHCASRPMIEEGFSKFPGDVLTCYQTDQQWLIRPPDVAGMIFAEEEKHISLLNGAEAVVKRVVAKRGWSKSTAAFLRDTHGIDEDISDSIANVTPGERS